MPWVYALRARQAVNDQSNDVATATAKRALSASPTDSATIDTNLTSPPTEIRPNLNSGNGQTESAEQEFRHFEKWQLVINTSAVVVGVAVCLIYYFQLQAMKSQLVVMQAQLAEMQAGSADTHALAIAADTQSKQAVAQTTKMEESIVKTDKLIEQAAKQASAAKSQSQQAEAQTRRMTESLARTDELIKATTDLARQAERSANVAQQSLALNQKAMDASTSSSHLDQRPWLLGEDFELSNEPQPGGSITVTFHLKNTGKTPAMEVAVQARIYSWPEEPPPPEFDSPGPGWSRGLASPGNTGFSFTSSPPLQFNTTQAFAYFSGTHKIYAHALISYLDIFKQPHWTKICIYHKYREPLGSWTYCEHGNDTDH